MAFSVIVKTDCETDGSAALAETFFFITHCLYFLSNCFSPLTPSHMSHVTYHLLTWCWCQCDASPVCNTLCDCLVSIKPRSWLFNIRNIVATQSVALVPGILAHPPSSFFIFILWSELLHNLLFFKHLLCPPKAQSKANNIYKLCPYQWYYKRVLNPKTSAH